MSEQEKQAAIAKVKAQGCRRWMTLLIITPVFICAVLTLLSPTIRNYLARQEANEECASLINTVEPVSNSTIFEINGLSGEAIITAGNLADMVLFSGEEELSASIASRGYPAIVHPEGDYVIYAQYHASASTGFFICDYTGKALGAFTADETARDVVFNSDGSLFAVSNGRIGEVMIFDAVNLRGIKSIDIRGNQDYRQIDSIAFHPVENLLFFTSENELFVYELENYRELLRLPIFETHGHEIGFNNAGSLFFMSSTGNDALSYIWGIRE